MTRIHISLLMLVALQWTSNGVSGKNIPQSEIKAESVGVPAQLAVESEQKGIPVAELEFEGGNTQDEQSVESRRQKRTIGMIGRMATCLMTFLLNPNCLNQMNEQQSYQRSVNVQASPSNNYHQQQMQYLQQQLAWQRAQNLIMSRYNGSDSNSSTNYPYPILSTYPPEQQPTESPDQPPPPSNPIMDIIQAKINFIPNMLRMLFPNTFGANRFTYSRPNNMYYSGNSLNQGYRPNYNYNNNNNLFSG